MKIKLLFFCAAPCRCAALAPIHAQQMPVISPAHPETLQQSIIAAYKFSTRKIVIFTDKGI